MIEALGQGIITLLQPMVFGFLVIGVLIALVVGVTPVLGGLMGLALLLPLVFRMTPEVGLSFLVAFHAVTYTAGSITAILLNIPGTGPNTATLFDGFPMNQKGEGGRAIGAAVMSSAAGGIVPVSLALLMIPLVLPILMIFKSPEMALLIVVGLSCLAALTGGSVIKGSIAGLFGMLIALVGVQGVTGVHRFSYGSVFLYDGLGIVPIALGLFGIAELFDLILRGQATISQRIVSQRMGDILQGVADVWRHKWLWLRSTIIGYIIGIIPGVGAETSPFITYAHAKQTSKNPERFGTGIVEGVIAPEAANNAKEAGSLLTTMAFGIPGSAAMAILLGAFVMVGVTPGPNMLVEHLPLAFTLLFGIALANIVAAVICLGAAPYLARVAFVHIDYLFPIVLAIALAGAFAMVNSMLNIVVAVIFGLVGLVMKRLGYSRPALLLGFVLGGLFEYYVINSLKFVGPMFPISSPATIILIVIIIGIFTYPYLMKVLAPKRLKQS